MLPLGAVVQLTECLNSRSFGHHKTTIHCTVSFRVISLPSVKHKIVFVRHQPKQQRPLMSPRGQADSFATTRTSIWFSAARSLLFWSGAHALISTLCLRGHELTGLHYLAWSNLSARAFHVAVIYNISMIQHGKRQQFCHTRHGHSHSNAITEVPAFKINVCFPEFVKKCERLLVFPCQLVLLSSDLWTEKCGFPECPKPISKLRNRQNSPQRFRGSKDS